MKKGLKKFWKSINLYNKGDMDMKNEKGSGEPMAVGR